MTSFYNIDLETPGVNGDVILTISGCESDGSASPRTDYEYKIYRNPIIAYTPATAAAGASFRIISQEGEKSAVLTMTSVINLNGSAHEAGNTEALASAIKELIIA